MKFTNFSVLDLKVDFSSIKFVDPLNDQIKEINYYDGSTDFVDFNAGQTKESTFKIVQLNQNYYRQLYDYLSLNVGVEVPIELSEGEDILDIGVDAPQSIYIVSVVPQSEQAFSELGTYALQLKVAQPMTEPVNSTWDFVIEVELNAWSVDEILPTGSGFPVGTPTGYTTFTEGGGAIPLAVHLGAEVWAPVMSKKAYEVTYYDFDRALTVPTFDGKNVGETFYSGGGTYTGLYGTWDGAQWNVEPYPPIDSFKPVILNSDIVGLKNSKFFWSSFGSVPIDNSDPKLLLPSSYTAGQISKKGIKFPSWSVALEKGTGVEKIRGFKFKLQNAQRLNIVTREINFFGAKCTLGVWDGSQSTVVKQRTGINKTNGFGFDGFEFEVEPELWNDAKKSIPVNTMATLLGDGGTELSDKYIPQTYGAVQYAKLEVLTQDVGVVEIGGVSNHQIIEKVAYSPVSKELDVKIACDQITYSYADTQQVKLFGLTDLFTILQVTRDPNTNSQQPTGALEFKLAGVSVDEENNLLEGQTLAVYNNDLRLIVDDDTLKGFGASLNLYSYNSDNDTYTEIPEGVYERVDDRTIRLTAGKGNIQANDDGTVYYSNSMLQIFGGNYSTYNRIIENNPEIDFTYGTFTGAGYRNSLFFGAKTYTNRPTLDPYTYRNVLKDITVNSFVSPYANIDLAYEDAPRWLPTPADTYIYQSQQRNGIFNTWIDGIRKQIDPFNTLDPYSNINENDPTAFYYSGSSGGRSFSAVNRRLNYVGGSSKIVVQDGSPYFIYDTDPDDIFLQNFPILSTTKTSLRGASNVRLLGSLYFEHYVIDSIKKFDLGNASKNESPFSRYGNVRVVMTLRSNTAGVLDRPIIDKTFNVDDQNTNAESFARFRTVTWSAGRKRHVFYNLPQTLGAVDNSYYGEEADISADYVTIVYKPDANNLEPEIGQTVITTSGTFTAGTVSYFWGGIAGEDRNLQTDYCEANIVMSAGNNFTVGQTFGTSGANGISGKILAVHTPKWWAGRDLWKLDDVDVEDLFNEENYLFGRYDRLEVKYIPLYDNITQGIRAGVGIGFAEPYTPLNEAKVGLYFETSTELDLGDSDNIFVSVEGRTDAENSTDGLVDNPEEVLRSQLAQIDPQATLDVTESAIRDTWKVHEQLTEAKDLDAMFSDYVNHIFGVITFDEEGGYRSSSLDYTDYNIQPSDFKVELNTTNVIKGSIRDVNYRDIDAIHNDFVFNYHYNTGKGKVDRQLTLSYNNDTGLVIGGLGSDPTETPELRNFKTNLRATIKAELEDAFRVSRNFYNSGQVSQKEITLPMFYDEEVFNTTGTNFAVGSVVYSAIKWCRYFLFNSWTIKLDVNMDTVITTGLRIGDLVTFEMDSITDDLKLFAFVREIKPKYYDGKAQLTLFASVDPYVYATFFDNVWDAGIVRNDYDPNNYLHTEFFKYPFRDTNQNGTFSDNGDLNDPYDEEDYKFSNGTTADPDETFNPLP